MSLQVAVQPPSVCEAGSLLDPPIVVTIAVSSTANGHGADLENLWASVVLLTEHGSVLGDGLSGSLATSVHVFANQDDAGYCIFNNVAIEDVGVYRLRISLVRMEVNGAVHVGQVETDLIFVGDNSVDPQEPSYTEQSFLNALPNLY